MIIERLFIYMDAQWDVRNASKTCNVICFAILSFYHSWPPPCSSTASVKARSVISLVMMAKKSSINLQNTPGDTVTLTVHQCYKTESGRAYDYLDGRGAGERQESRGLQTGMYWGPLGPSLQLCIPHPGIQEWERWRERAEAADETLYSNAQ